MPNACNDSSLSHLQDLLILLGVGMLHLLGGLDIILQVIASTPVCGQAVLEELADLEHTSVSMDARRVQQQL